MAKSVLGVTNAALGAIPQSPSQSFLRQPLGGWLLDLNAFQCVRQMCSQWQIYVTGSTSNCSSTLETNNQMRPWELTLDTCKMSSNASSMSVVNLSATSGSGQRLLSHFPRTDFLAARSLWTGSFPLSTWTGQVHARFLLWPCTFRVGLFVQFCFLWLVGSIFMRLSCGCAEQHLIDRAQSLPVILQGQNHICLLGMQSSVSSYLFSNGLVLGTTLKATSLNQDTNARQSCLLSSSRFDTLRCRQVLHYDPEDFALIKFPNFLAFWTSPSFAYHPLLFRYSYANCDHSPGLYGVFQNYSAVAVKTKLSIFEN